MQVMKRGRVYRDDDFIILYKDVSTNVKRFELQHLAGFLGITSPLAGADKK